jgi:hypothetical protein
MNSGALFHTLVLPQDKPLQGLGAFPRANAQKFGMA